MSVKRPKCRRNRKTLNVDKGLHTRLKVVADTKGIPLQHLVEFALDLYLVKHEPKHLHIK